MEGDAEQIQKALSTLLLNHFPYFLSSSTILEKVYQVFLYGLLLCLTTKGYVVNVEQEAGHGRYDIRCQQTIGDNSKAIIIELKAVPLTVRTRIARRKRTKKQLEKHMEVQLLAAMNQLEERQYYSSLESHITTVHEYGICFAGKLCVVGSRTRTRGDSAMDWVVAPTKVSGAHFEQKDINERKVVEEVEEVLEETISKSCSSTMQLTHQRLVYQRRRLVDLPIAPRPVPARPVPILFAHLLVTQPSLHRRRRGKGTVLPKVCVTTPWPILDSH